MSELWRALTDFAHQGGPVIWLLLLVSVLMWTLIGERLLYLLWVSRRQSAMLRRQWLQRVDRQSWFAHRVREGLIVEMSIRLNQCLGLLRTLVLLCPLLGLLGTVTGMVAVFDVIAWEGTSDAQGMARGVYRATLPTMAGLVISISGLYMLAQLQRWTRQGLQRFADSLTLSGSAGPGSAGSGNSVFGHRGAGHGNP